MPAKHEFDAMQATTLYELLDLQAQNKGIQVKGLKAKIQRARAVMTEPEIAWVEKQIAELYSQDE